MQVNGNIVPYFIKNEENKMKVALYTLDQVNHDTHGYISVTGLLNTIDECLIPETTMDTQLIKYFKKCIAHQVYLGSNTEAKEPKQDKLDTIPKEKLYFAALTSLLNDNKTSESNKPDESIPEVSVMDETGAINTPETEKPDTEMLKEICRNGMIDTQIIAEYNRGCSDTYRCMYEFLTGWN